jgi:ribosomal-protein-alanine N-acetyltransferase
MRLSWDERPVELQTQRLILRPFHVDDVEDVLSYAADPEFGRYLIDMPDHPYTRSDAAEFLARTVPTPTETNADFAVVFEGHVIGAVDLTVDPNQRTAELGYAIARAFWGRGLAPEAATALLDWGFRTFDIDKVFASANAENVKSHRVMDKLGMKQEALLRQHRHFRGRQVDKVVYAILRDEWASRQPLADR